MTIYPYLGVCTNPDGEGYNFPMAKRDEACPVEDCECTPVVYVLAAEAERMWAAGETIATLQRERDRAIETRENANACTLRVEAERDRFRQGLIDCATFAGADVSDGPPDWPSLEEWAVEAVKELREVADEDASRTSDPSRTLEAI